MNGIQEAIISAVSSFAVGILALIGVIITNSKSGKDLQHKLDTAQAVTETKLEALTLEVRKHNNFAVKIPVIEEQIKVINHRISDCENIMLQ